ncbi:MAG: hypothetical protein H0W78_00800 [Planctomycetes bacterium]|nr:hypothetical protein [Planctomycetota bacterium]
MQHLAWSFDWPVRRAVAVSAHGSYVITGEAHGCWTARFTRAGTEQFRRPAHEVGKAPEYPSVADAMRACHRHAERFSDESSDRLSVCTPFP